MKLRQKINAENVLRILSDHVIRMACQALLQHPSQNEILREAFGQRLTVSQIYGTTFACPTPFFPGWNIIAKIEIAFTHISIHFDGLDLCKDHTHCFHSCVYFAAWWQLPLTSIRHILSYIDTSHFELWTNPQLDIWSPTSLWKFGGCQGAPEGSPKLRWNLWAATGLPNLDVVLALWTRNAMVSPFHVGCNGEVIIKWSLNG